MKNLYKVLKMFFFLSLFWLAISGIFEKEMIIYMFISVTCTLFITSSLYKIPNIRITFTGLKYIFIMIKNIIISSKDTISLVNDDKSKYESGMHLIFFPSLKDDISIVLYAASITMTPGTTVLAVDKAENQMLVQGLNKEWLKDLPDNAILEIVSENTIEKRKIRNKFLSLKDKIS